MRFRLYIPVFYSLLYFSCGSQKTSGSNPDFVRFDTEIPISEEKLFSFQGIFPDGLLLADDSTLVIRNTVGKSSFHFQVLDLAKKQLGPQFLPSGRKQGQSMGFLSFGKLNDGLWVNDIIKEKILLLDPGNPERFSEYRIPVFYYSSVLLNDSVLLGSGNYESHFKLESYNIRTGKLIRQIIPFSGDPGVSVPREQKMAYESFLFTHPDGDRCVMACRYADQIEIVDLVQNRSKIIKGPEGYEPDVVVATGNDGQKLSTRNNDTRFAFVKGKTTNEFIYLLYSGHNHQSEHLHYGNGIFVYDWEGRPVKKLLFKDDIIDFVVTSDNQVIYACHPKGNFLTKIRL